MVLVAAFSFLVYSNALISLSPEAQFGVTECCGDCCLYIIPGEVTVKTVQNSGEPYFQDFLVVDVSSTPGACFDGGILDITSKAAKESTNSYVSLASGQLATLNFAEHSNGYAFVSTKIITASSPLSDYDQLRFYRGADMCGAVPINISVEGTNNEAFGFNPLHTEFLNASVGAASEDSYSLAEESNVNPMDVTGASTEEFIYVEDLKNSVITTLDMNETVFDKSSFIIPKNSSDSVSFSMTPSITEISLPTLFVSLNEFQTNRGQIKIPIAAIVYPEGLDGGGYVSKSVPGIGVLGFALISMISLMILVFTGRNKKSAV